MRLDFITSKLKNPSAYLTDPVGYVKNQLGHSLLIGAIPCLLFGPIAFFITLAWYTVWEVYQWYFYDAEVADCLEDYFFVIASGMAVVASPYLAPWVLLRLVEGYCFRKETLRKEGN